MANAVKIGYEVIERTRIAGLEYPAAGAEPTVRVVREMTLAKISDGTIYVEPNGRPITFPGHEREFTLKVTDYPGLTAAYLAVLAELDAIAPTIPAV